MRCLDCGADLIQPQKKKEKIFCNSSCRSNYWQRSKRLEIIGVPPEEIVNRLQASLKTKKAPIKIKEQKQEIVAEIKNDSMVIETAPNGLTGLALKIWLNKQEILNSKNK